MTKGLERLKEILKHYELKSKYNNSPTPLWLQKEYLEPIMKELKAISILKNFITIKEEEGHIEVKCNFSIPSKKEDYKNSANILKEVLL